jgi:hypothetical protein
MSEAPPSLPERAFDDVVAVLLERFGEAWIANAKANRAFAQGAAALLRDVDGIHLIGEPEMEKHALHFNIWIDFPVEDVIVADDVAFGIFARLAEDIFLTTRVFEDRGLRYRFLTGTGLEGHMGSIHLTGPHAAEFVALHRLRTIKGLQYNA